MLTVFVEVIMRVFIANFKASEYPIINISVIRDRLSPVSEARTLE